MGHCAGSPPPPRTLIRYMMGRGAGLERSRAAPRETIESHNLRAGMPGGAGGGGSLRVARADMEVTPHLEADQSTRRTPVDGSPWVVDQIWIGAPCAHSHSMVAGGGWVEAKAMRAMVGDMWSTTMEKMMSWRSLQMMVGVLYPTQQV